MKDSNRRILLYFIAEIEVQMQILQEFEMTILIAENSIFIGANEKIM